MADNPLAKLGDLTKPATVLIEKISDAVGGIFKPYQIIRVAKAEAEADKVRAESQIQITDLQRRAMHRFLEEEAKKQSNIEGITQRALPLLDENAAPEKLNDDWITNFFDKARIVSDEDMQELWSRVLAGQANSPGAFSKKTVNLLSDLEKSDAELFAALCSFGWTLGNIVPLVFDEQDSIYTDNRITFNNLSHLESLGLVQFNWLAGFVRKKLPKVVIVAYYGRCLELTLPNDSNNDLSTGKVLLTKAGQELAKICGSRPIDGFFPFVRAKWAAESVVSREVGSAS
ncbi:MAG: DUF2806 domain-containing protein [Acidobacteriia bacterium]|nr:DUF2806 domain-containing protein [Terriglobia bacterium]